MTNFASPNADLIRKIPPSVLATTPAEAPPPGVVSDFVNRPTTVPLILGLSYAFLLVALFTYGIRIWTKSFIVKRWQWDDATITLGFIFGIVHLIAVTRGATHAATGKHGWDVSLAQALSAPGLQQSYITVITVTPALGLIKLSLFIQYYRLFNVRRYIRICVWVGASVSMVFYFTIAVCAFALSSPWPGEDLLDTILSWHYLKFAEFAIPTGVIGMVTDLYLFVLPIPAVWALHLSFERKVGLSLIFATGGVASIASMVSLYYRIRIQSNMADVTWKVGYVLLWSMIEMFAGVTASSMPTVRQFFNRQPHLQSWTSSIRRSILGLSSPNPRDSGEVLPGHVATLRHWTCNKSRAGNEAEEGMTEKRISDDLESGRSSPTQVADDNVSRTAKEAPSVSIRSVSDDSYHSYRMEAR